MGKNCRVPWNSEVRRGATRVESPQGNFYHDFSSLFDYVSLIDSTIILIGGPRLTPLMFDNGIGVSPASKYEVKWIDSDYFNDTWYSYKGGQVAAANRIPSVPPGNPVAELGRYVTLQNMTTCWSSMMKRTLINWKDCLPSLYSVEALVEESKIVGKVINSRYVRNCAELTPEFRWPSDPRSTIQPL